MQTLEAKPFACFSDTKVIRDMFQRLPEFADTPFRLFEVTSIARRIKSVAEATHLLARVVCPMQNWFIQKLEQEFFHELI